MLATFIVMMHQHSVDEQLADAVKFRNPTFRLVCSVKCWGHFGNASLDWYILAVWRHKLLLQEKFRISTIIMCNLQL